MIRNFATAAAKIVGTAALMAFASFAQAQEIEITDIQEGNPEATVTIIEYASYTCPHCASFHSNQYQDLKANYIDTGKINFVYREVYFDRYGLWASMVARCDETKFHGITDLLYKGQSTWTKGSPAQIAENLRTLGRVAGLSEDQLSACLSDAAMAQGLFDWFETNAEADGIKSTPSILINGENQGNLSYADLSALIDEKLAE